jgi:hypothetical protein
VAGNIATLIALAQQQVFLSVRLAHVRAGKCRDPDKGLWHGLDIQNIEGEPAALVNESAAHGQVGIIQINSSGAEATDYLAFSQSAVRHSALGLRSCAGYEEQEQSESLHDESNLSQKNRGQA